MAVGRKACTKASKAILKKAVHANYGNPGMDPAIRNHPHRCETHARKVPEQE